MFFNINLKVGNMKKAQEFVLYPYDGDNKIHLQSDKRWITYDLETNKGLVTDKNYSHATRMHLAMGAIPFQMDQDNLNRVIDYLKTHSGLQSNGCLVIENAEFRG